MKEAYLYDKLEDKKVRCKVCSHRCVILPEKTGICQVRKNIDGTLYSLVYEKVAGVAIDPMEKKPLYHFFPNTSILSIGTVGCNFKCDFCQNYHLSFATNIYGDNIKIEKLVNLALEYDCIGIAYTYNEPTIFLEMVYDTAKLANKKGLRNVLVTNGFMTSEAIEFLHPLINAANIDLKSFDDDFYKKICKGKLNPVLDNIKLMHKKRIHIEITTLIIPDENDDDENLKKIANFIAKIDKNIVWHISRFFPCFKMADKNITPIETLNKAKKIGEMAGLKYVYIGNV